MLVQTQAPIAGRDLRRGAPRRAGARQRRAAARHSQRARRDHVLDRSARGRQRDYGRVSARVSPTSKIHRRSSASPRSAKTLRACARGGSPSGSSVSLNVPQCIAHERARAERARSLAGVFGVHVLRLHEPARLVGADRQHRPVDRTERAGRSRRSRRRARCRPSDSATPSGAR